MTQNTTNQENELWFLRHGRAGIENEYDALSEDGYNQANAFGQYCQDMQIEFDSVYVGSLRRQQETATTVVSKLPNFTVEQIITHEALNEFSPRHVVRVISKLRETNKEVRAIVDEWMLKWNQSVDAGKPMFHKIMEYFLEAWVDEPGDHGFDSWANSVIEGFSKLPNQ
ncbi:MAG: histidine phosphatase family protein, partial [Leptonema sp. (in: Bacteria)]|nr:histidine phosphatase family protein [Leptonema sp. (in: bacteria)]